MSITDVLSPGPWIERKRPFRHIVVRSVFQPTFAAAVRDAARHLICSPGSLRHFGWYDAYAYRFQHGMEGPLSLFISREWHDLIAQVMGTPATGHINGGIHHHPIGTASGFVHNDLNPVYFDRDPLPGEVVLPNESRVSYTLGTVRDPGSLARKVIRCTALIYYMANPAWHVGDAGETGLYRRANQDLRYPDERVPPISNSMLVFNCTPTSFHAFIQNWRSERNSIVMWLHAPPEDMARRFGANTFVSFRPRPDAGVPVR